MALTGRLNGVKGTVKHSLPLWLNGTFRTILRRGKDITLSAADLFMVRQCQALCIRGACLTQVVLGDLGRGSLLKGGMLERLSTIWSYTHLSTHLPHLSIS